MKRKFLSMRVISELKRDEARMNAIAKRTNRRLGSTRVVYCSCGVPDCIGLIADFHKN